MQLCDSLKLTLAKNNSNYPKGDSFFSKVKITYCMSKNISYLHSYYVVYFNAHHSCIAHFYNNMLYFTV